MIPESLLYSREHEWILKEGDTVTVGITYYAQDELGDIVYVELPSEGDELEQNQEIGVVESVKTVSNLYSPITGTVTEVNEAVADTPDLLNTEPYGDGWLIKMTISDEKELDGLLDNEDYETLIEG